MWTRRMFGEWKLSFMSAVFLLVGVHISGNVNGRLERHRHDGLMVLISFLKANAENVQNFTRSNTQFSYSTRYLWYLKSVYISPIQVMLVHFNTILIGWSSSSQGTVSQPDHLQRLKAQLCSSFNPNYWNGAERKDSFTYSGNPIIVVAGHNDTRNGSHQENMFSEVITLVINVAVPCQ